MIGRDGMIHVIESSEVTGVKKRTHKIFELTFCVNLLLLVLSAFNSKAERENTAFELTCEKHVKLEVAIIMDAES